MLRIKQLQNQLADAHFHLNELSNENKLLKAIQKRQDAALKRYEGTNAELPRIINTHHEDLRVLQTKHKKLKSQYNSLSDTLKEKDNELHSLQAQNKKLLQLSKDRHLGEREKLQTQVFDLTHRINEQDETIQTLKRKLELETKYLKHQLHVEMVKHKETQKELEDAHKKLQQLERLSEQRLKRSYQASHLTYHSKSRASVTSQSLTNLSEAPSEHPFKLHSFRKLVSEATTNQSLPSLNGALSTPTRSHETLAKRANSLDKPSSGTEALASLETNRSVRLQKSPVALPSTSCKSTARDSLTEESVQEETRETLQVNSERKTYELPKSLKKEYDYSTDDEKSIKNSRSSSNDSLSDNYASRSRSLHARLVNSASDGVRTNKTTVSIRSRSLTKENLENIMENERGEIKYDRDSVVTVITKEIPAKDDLDVKTNDSNSDIESEMEIPVAYAADEDDNAQRKSDVIIEDIEIHRHSNTSSHLSSLFSHLRKPPNFSFGSKQTTEEKLKQSSGQKEINGLTKKVDEKISISNKVIKTSWDDDAQDEKSSSDKVTGDEENDIATCAEKLLNEVTENLKETSELESSTDRNNSMNKADLKNTVDNSNDIASKSFDKAKLLAAMKAIDDNENIEFVEQKARKNSASNRLRITENLYRGVPTHKKKSELMKELFSDKN